MAEPKLEIDRRLDRIELAITQMAEATLTPTEEEEIKKILRGEKSEESKEDIAP